MKRIFLILCILSFPILLLGQDPWVDSGGSTWTPTASQVALEIKVIQNDVHDRTNSSIRITISSQTIFLIDEMGHIWVRASTNSLTGIYYGNNTAVVRAGDSDEISPTIQGLQTQANMHVYNSNKWHRLIGQSTDYHNLRVSIYDRDRIWEVNDFDSDDQAEGRDGVIVYSYISGWDGVSDNWDRLRCNPMKYLYVVTSTESWVRVIESSCVVKNFPTDFPDATAQSSLSSIDTNTDNIYEQLKTSVTTSDILYSGKVSTGTAGKIFASGNISLTGGVEFYMFYTEGGNATVTGTWFGGTKYVREGIPFKPDKLSIPITDPTFQCVLDAGTTLYYDSNIVKVP